MASAETATEQIRPPSKSGQRASPAYLWAPLHAPAVPCIEAVAVASLSAPAEVLRSLRGGTGSAQDAVQQSQALKDQTRAQLLAGFGHTAQNGHSADGSPLLNG